MAPLLVIEGPDAAGKSTLVGALVRQRDGAVLEVRPGTRAHLALVERWVATHRSAVRGSDEAREVERVVVWADRGGR